MPQIKVNEIDQSVVTRVVSDNRVKILVPAVLSFGPAFDGTADSVMTFTDVTDFNRCCGYTEAEFNPFTDDKSRTYARELIKRGGAVSVVRVNNNGQLASFDIGSQTAIPTAVLRSIPSYDIIDGEVSNITVTNGSATITGGNVIPFSVTGSISYTVNGGTALTATISDDGNGAIVIDGVSTKKVTASINYSTGVVTFEYVDETYVVSTITSCKYNTVYSANAYKYKFCPQISGIEAKYPGSFGNNLYMSISQITTKNIAEAYQYANITVYYIDVKTNYNADGSLASKVVGNVTQLETKRVSTNPNDPYYFEDIEFDFIRIRAVPTAREELSLVWSNIQAAPQSSNRYSGFPTIKLKYIKDNYSYYNLDCVYSGGCDFAYSEDVLEKLQQGFKGYTVGGKWTAADVDKYLQEVYVGPNGNDGIIASIYANIAECYNNFTDPYIYDFDFITSGGFVYKEYNVSTVPTLKTLNPVTVASSSATEVAKLTNAMSTEGLLPILPGTVYITQTKGDVKKVLADTGKIITDTSSSYLGTGEIKTEDSSLVMYIDYRTGLLHLSSDTSSFTDATYEISYGYDSGAVSPSQPYTSSDLKLPTAVGSITHGTVTVSNVISGDPNVTNLYSDFFGDGNLYKYTVTEQDPFPTVASPLVLGGTIDYASGQITASAINVESGNTVSITYSNDTKPDSASVVVPSSDGEESYYLNITPIHQAMLNLVETRQDCVAIFDLPKDYSKTACIDYSGMLNTSYGAIYNPWCYVASPDVANTNILMAPSYIFLYTFLSNLDNNVDAQKWFPPAGVKRATARVIVKPYYEIGSVTLNMWQNDDISRVNPFMKLKQYGYVIYGQYTTLQAIDLHTHSALESLNVRLISNVVKKKIFDACLNLAFEPNTENLWNKFYAQMDEFLRYMKYNDGLYDYRIVMDKSTVTTDDINHLRCPGKVYIAPTRTAEFFDIDFIITEAGAIFS